MLCCYTLLDGKSFDAPPRHLAYWKTWDPQEQKLTETSALLFTFFLCNTGSYYFLGDKSHIGKPICTNRKESQNFQDINTLWIQGGILCSPPFHIQDVTVLSDLLVSDLVCARLNLTDLSGFQTNPIAPRSRLWDLTSCCQGNLSLCLSLNF